MIDLTKAVLPSSITAGGRQYKIKTWFKHWLCFLNEFRLPPEKRTFDFLFEGEIPEDKEEALRALAAFSRPENPLPRDSGGIRDKVPVLDYAVDSDMLYAAFMQCYGIDLVNGLDSDGTKLHWHKFLALCSSLKGTKLNDVMEARTYDENDKSTYDEARRKMRDAWTLDGLVPTAEEEAAEISFNASFA